MEYKLKRIGRELLYGGSALDFYKDKMELPSGNTEDWEFVHHRRGGGACVVPVREDGTRDIHTIYYGEIVSAYILEDE